MFKASNIVSMLGKITKMLALKTTLVLAVFLFFASVAAVKAPNVSASYCAWCGTSNDCPSGFAGSGAGYCVSGTQCCAGWVPDSPPPGTSPAPTSSPTYNAAACTNACKAIKGQVNGGVVSGRQVAGKNDGGQANCECYCSTGTWTQGYAACDGGAGAPVIYPECTPGQTGTRQQDGCAYTCNSSGIWVKNNPSCGTSGTPVPTNSPGGSLPPGAVCNPGSRPSGNEFYNIDADIQCGTCAEGAVFGRYCTMSGQWSTGCVRAHACGYVPSSGECTVSTFVTNGENETVLMRSDECAARGYPNAGCNNAHRCVNLQTGDFFIGCDPTDPCKNCWQDGATGAITCRLEDSSCSANVNCRTPVATATPPGGSTPPGTTPPQTTTPFVCLSVTKDVASPQFGQSVRFTCGTVATATRYEFQYKVGDFIGVINTTTPTSNVTQPLPISRRGTYQVQCRPCNANGCTPWTDAWTGQMCGGIAAIRCPNGLVCDLGSRVSQPDATGTCQVNTGATTTR